MSWPPITLHDHAIPVQRATLKEEAQRGRSGAAEAKQLYISQSGVNVCICGHVRGHDQDAPVHRAL